MPRSRSRSPRARRDDSDRRHRSRRYDEGRHDRRRDEREHERGSKREREKNRERSSREKSYDQRDHKRSSHEKSYDQRDYERSPRDRRDHKRSSREKSPTDERVARRDPRSRFQTDVAASSLTPATGANAPEVPVEKEAPNFAQTGMLAAATNTVNGVVLKYSEPAEARKPPASQRWRLFVFKDKEIVDTVDLNGNSCWLVGRDRAVADLPVDHPSCSKQHAVLQFRHVVKVGEFGDREAGVKPYIIDLESANGTTVGKVRVPERRYLELKEGDLIMFGLSTREYILMLDKD